MLHARHLAIDQRGGRRIELSAEPPPDEPLWSAFEDALLN